MTGDDIRTHYFTAMRGADLDGVLALFAEDASVILPDGIIHNGKAALATMFASILQNRAQPSSGPITGAGNYWAVEVETTLADGAKRNTANFFKLNDAGLVQSMHSYRRG